MITILAAVILGQFKTGDYAYILPGMKGYPSAEAAVSRTSGFERPYDKGRVIAARVVDGESLLRLDSTVFELPMWIIANEAERWTQDAEEVAVAYHKGRYEDARKVIEDVMKSQKESAKQDLEKAEAKSAEMKKAIEGHRVELFLLTLDPDVRKIARDRMDGDQDLTLEKAKRITNEVIGSEARRRAAADTMSRFKPFCITKPDHAALTVAIGKGLDPLKMTGEEASTLSASQRKSLSGIKARYMKANGSARR